MKYHHPRCEVIPLAGHRVSLQIDGRERTRWHFGSQYPGPFFYPLIGPDSGTALTRMGHPGAENHDHHRSVWFAHHKLLGIDFWGYASTASMRQQRWLVYEDGDEEACLAVSIGWFDGHDPQPLVEQELIAFLRPLENGYLLDLQSTFTPRARQIEFGQTNFGFLAVRVAKSVSAYFGGGAITNSDGAVGEPDIFGKPARWMDYSGPVPLPHEDGPRSTVWEGVTYFDHPQNPAYPVKWHVREDGWMGASACRDAPLVTTREKPLVLRYLLHVHSGAIDAKRADEVAEQWLTQPFYRVVKGTRPHHQFELERLPPHAR